MLLWNIYVEVENCLLPVIRVIENDLVVRMTLALDQ